jgi:hypothetical protein
MYFFKYSELANVINLHLQVSCVVDEQVFWLEVPINEVQVVEVLKGQHDLCSVESRLGFTEAANLAQVREHLTSRYVFQDHVQV